MNEKAKVESEEEKDVILNARVIIVVPLLS